MFSEGAWELLLPYGEPGGSQSRTEVDEAFWWGVVRNPAQYLLQVGVLGWFFIHLPKSQARS